VHGASEFGRKLAIEAHIHASTALCDLNLCRDEVPISCSGALCVAGENDRGRTLAEHSISAHQ
jgi:hypothetical protein